MAEKLQLLNGKTLTYFPHRKIGEGSEKTFYQTRNPGYVVGIYNDQSEDLNQERIKRLKKIIYDYNPTLDAETGKKWKSFFCWPEYIVVSPGQGFLCRRFPAQFYFKNKVEKKGKWFSRINLAAKMDAADTCGLRARIRICRSLAGAVGRLHSSGLAHSDLSGNNVLMDPSGGSCMIIDIDSLVVRGCLPPNVLGTHGYMAPEIVSTQHLPFSHPGKQFPNINTDLHSLAVMIYETLLMRHPLDGKLVYASDPQEDDRLRFGDSAVFIEDPQNSANRPDHLKSSVYSMGSFLPDLFIKAFSDGLKSPDLRPTAIEWEDALIKTLHSLQPCRNEDCEYRWFIRNKKKRVCPFCKEELNETNVGACIFKENKEKGQYHADREFLTLWQDEDLFDEGFPTQNLTEAPNRKSEKAAGRFVKKDHKNFFLNNSGYAMKDSRGRRLLPGETVEIEDGLVIAYSQKPGVCLIYFEC